MTTRRRILADALDEWRASEALDEPTHARLRGALDRAPPSPDLDEDLAVTASAPAGPGAPGTGRSFAADAMQFVGGLLLGAAIIALTVFLDVPDDVAPWVLVLSGALLVAAGLAAASRGLRGSLVDAALAAGLVPLVVGGIQSITGSVDRAPVGVLPILATLLAGSIAPLRRGEGPGTFLGVLAFTIMSWAAVFQGENAFFSDPAALPRFLWLAVLLVYGALLLLWRSRVWVGATLGFYVAPLTLAFANILDLWPLTSLGTEVALGVFLGALVVAGVALGARGLVAGASAGLTIDAVVFAFDLGGAGVAVVVLLSLGGLLVWQAEVVRRYFGQRAG